MLPLAVRQQLEKESLARVPFKAWPLLPEEPFHRPAIIFGNVGPGHADPSLAQVQISSARVPRHFFWRPKKAMSTSVAIWLLELTGVHCAN